MVISIKKLNIKRLFRASKEFLTGRHEQTFAEAVEVALQTKAAKRPRTRAEFRHFCRRIMLHSPKLSDRPLGEIGHRECQELISDIFPTERQRDKARRILHNLFEINIRSGYCDHNPIAVLPHPVIPENEIQPLPWEQLKSLLRMIQEVAHRPCMAPMGLMLWAGIRPAEVTRLDWGCIDWEENIISLKPRHSKTGGSRHITLYPVLRHWLRLSAEEYKGSICPPNWHRRWKALREAAVSIPWQQDVLRHTFASYHVKRWHDFALLQSEMGHRSADLLRTRYLSMKGITKEQAVKFWTPGAL